MSCRISAALFGLLFTASAIAAASPPPGDTQRSTTHSVQAFRNCFIASQEKAGRPWAYVPDEAGGGTFSTVPGGDGNSPYYLLVREGDGARMITLTGEASPAAGRAIATAVHRCLR